jgi:hypothetical protein
VPAFFFPSFRDDKARPIFRVAGVTVQRFVIGCEASRNSVAQAEVPAELVPRLPERAGKLDDFVSLVRVMAGDRSDIANDSA